MSDDSIERTLGDHSAQLTNLQREVRAIATNVESLIASENKREGSKKVLWGIAAALGTISGSVAAKFLK
jgi:hypothetical protein